MYKKTEKSLSLVLVIFILLFLIVISCIIVRNREDSIAIANNSSQEVINSVDTATEETVGELYFNEINKDAVDNEEDDKSSLGNMELLTSRNEYLSAKQCVAEFNYITSKLAYQMNNQLEPGDNQDYGQLLVNLLDKSQIELLGINKDNAYFYAGFFNFVTQSGYKLQGDFDTTSIILYGYRINLANNTFEDYSYAVRFDSSSKTYSLFTNDYLTQKGFSTITYGQKIQLYDSELSNNGNNIFRFINSNSYDIAQDYLNTFKINAICKPELAYKELNEEYAIKFGSVEMFQNYINNNQEKLNAIVVNGCNKVTSGGNDKYVCQDSMGNVFTILATPERDIFNFKIEFSNIIL